MVSLNLQPLGQVGDRGARRAAPRRPVRRSRTAHRAVRAQRRQPAVPARAGRARRGRRRHPRTAQLAAGADHRPPRSALTRAAPDHRERRDARHLGIDRLAADVRRRARPTLRPGERSRARRPRACWRCAAGDGSSAATRCATPRTRRSPRRPGRAATPASPRRWPTCPTGLDDRAHHTATAAELVKELGPVEGCLALDHRRGGRSC